MVMCRNLTLMSLSTSISPGVDFLYLSISAPGAILYACAHHTNLHREVFVHVSEMTIEWTNNGSS